MFKKKKRIEKIEEKIKSIESLHEELRITVKQAHCPHLDTCLTEFFSNYFDTGHLLYKEVCNDCGKMLRVLNEKEYYLAKKEKAGQRINEAKKEIQEMERKIKEME